MIRQNRSPLKITRDPCEWLDSRERKRDSWSVYCNCTSTVLPRALLYFQCASLYFDRTPLYFHCVSLYSTVLPCALLYFHCTPLRSLYFDCILLCSVSTEVSPFSLG